MSDFAMALIVELQLRVGELERQITALQQRPQGPMMIGPGACNPSKPEAKLPLAVSWDAAVQRRSRKTLGEIASTPFPGGYKYQEDRWNESAKAVAEAIIERHLSTDYARDKQLIDTIRKEFKVE